MTHVYRLLLSLLLALPAATCLTAGTYYNHVTPDTFAIDVTPGEFSIEKALQEARLRRLHGEERTPVIRLHTGVYRLSQPVVIRPEDSGTRIVGQPGVVVSGGVTITGWHREGRLWVADVPLWNGRPLEFRQLWVDGRKAVRARNVPVDGTNPFERMFRICAVDKGREVVCVPASSLRPSPDSKDNAAARRLLKALGTGEEGLEMVLHEMWCTANLRVRTATLRGDTVALTFHNPESHVHFMHPWPSPVVSPDGAHNSPFYLTGSRTLLDEPGEWHLDTRRQRLYYMPRDGEDMNTATVVAPALETLLRVEGTPDEPVHDVTLEGIAFAHATWMRPSLMGHAPLQAGMFLTEAYRIRPQISRPNGDHKLDNQGWVGRPAAAVSVSTARNVVFDHCLFEHCASTAIDYHRYTDGGSISHCRFSDIGGTAILAGSFGPEGHEAHKPYDPADRREACSGLLVCHNRIDDAANEDWGAIGIAAGFVRGICIADNEISNVSYTGISLGWGWNQQTTVMTNNTVRHNYIHHYARHLYDTAGIYTLGAQPHTVIEENVIDSICTPSYVHDPDHWFYLYTDEGSAYITVRNNWTPTEKFLRNANGPGCTWENNGPQAGKREPKWQPDNADSTYFQGKMR